jgi:hypothetical protein
MGFGLMLTSSGFLVAGLIATALKKDWSDQTSEVGFWKVQHPSDALQ